jgi:hypothetical protein
MYYMWIILVGVFVANSSTFQLWLIVKTYLLEESNSKTKKGRCSGASISYSYFIEV